MEKKNEKREKQLEIRLGIVGLGTVGQGVVELLEKHAAFYSRELGFDFRFVAAGARLDTELDQVRDPRCLKTKDALEVANHPDVDVFIELAGGEDMPKPWIEAALKAGKHVVTANKAMLAKHGAELFPLASKNGRQLMFEAAVGGGIPIIRALQESLVGNDIEGLACIINGTCNYILTDMTAHKGSFEAALAEAQRLGYAEYNPTFDVDGIDSLHKVALLASLAYGRYVDYRKLHVEGIRNIAALDIQTAGELGYEVKLLGVVTEVDGKILAAVYPALLEKSHQLASVHGVLNAVYLKNSAAGPQLFTGAGAGRYPTASAVTADLVAVARTMRSGAKNAMGDGVAPENAADLLSIDELETEFYLRLTTVDKPGVLSRVTGLLGEEGISIRALSQKPEHDPENVPVTILTHAAKNARVMAALKKIDALDVIREPTRVIRFYK
jgi:homoserine dehydrogenase